MRLPPILIAAALVGCAAAQPAPTLPPARAWNAPREQLDRRDIVDGLNAVKSRVAACFDRYHKSGFFEAAITIISSGQVSAVHVRGPDVEMNDCIGTAVATARFPSFTGGPTSIVYPYAFH